MSSKPEAKGRKGTGGRSSRSTRATLQRAAESATGGNGDSATKGNVELFAQEMPPGGADAFGSFGDLNLDTPAEFATCLDYVKITSTGTITALGHVADGLTITTGDGSLTGKVDDPNVAVPGSDISVAPWTYTISGIPCTPGRRTLTVEAVFDDDNVAVPAPINREFVALPDKFRFKFSGLSNGANICQECTDLNTADPIELTYEPASGVWRKILGSSQAVCSYSIATLSIADTGSDSAYVQFWIRKTGLGAPLCTYVNPTWDYDGTSIELLYSTDNDICENWPASITVDAVIP